MGPLVGVATDAGTIESGLGDHGDRAARRKTDIGCRRAQKQSATRRLGSSITQVGNDGCADVWWDRHPGALPTLGANEHRAGSPVDIF
jgi:hypothetical protein